MESKIATAASNTVNISHNATRSLHQGSPGHAQDTETPKIGKEHPVSLCAARS